MDGEIDPETLRAAIEAGDPPLVVDIRGADAFAEGHLPGSVHVPLADLPGEIERIAEADDVVTVCPHGKASVKAARIVGAYRDFDGRVESLAGGLEAWDGPIETGEPAADEFATGAAEAEESDDAPDAPF